MCEEDALTQISIIIPAYNVAQYVRAAVESALEQTWHDIEVIVVNDGSTDDTRHILDILQKERKDTRLRIIDKENGGLASARNAGIHAARGKYIGLLDADDLWDKSKAEKHINLMEFNPDIGLTYSHSRCISEQGHPAGMLISIRAELTLSDLIRRNYIGNGSAPVIRADCFRTAGLFNEEMRGRGVEDYEMWCRILHTGCRAVLVPEPLTVYRLRDGSMSNNFQSMADNADDAMRSLREKMPDVPNRIFCEGHAQHYRHIAWRAATNKQRNIAIRYFVGALQHCPWMLFQNWRALGTIGAIVLPDSLRVRIFEHVHAKRSKMHFRWQP
jgi:glycosyltransferase involved in cell wall biosynthesis